MRAEEQIHLASGEVYRAAIDEIAGFLREMVTALHREQGHIGSLVHRCPILSRWVIAISLADSSTNARYCSVS